jgi:hypothetical protein
MRTHPWAVLLLCLCPALGGAVHALKLGSDTAPVGLWVGALEGYSLLLFPEADGALRPGAFASLGLGVDNAR